MSGFESWMIPRGFRARSGPDGVELYRDPAIKLAHRVRGVLDSLHSDIRAGSRVRVRRVLAGPVDVYRLELERRELACRRTTLLDGDTFETLLEELGPDAVESAFQFA